MEASADDASIPQNIPADFESFYPDDLLFHTDDLQLQAVLLPDAAAKFFDDTGIGAKRDIEKIISLLVYTLAPASIKPNLIQHDQTLGDFIATEKVVLDADTPNDANAHAKHTMWAQMTHARAVSHIIRLMKTYKSKFGRKPFLVDAYKRPIAFCASAIEYTDECAEFVAILSKIISQIHDSILDPEKVNKLAAPKREYAPIDLPDLGPQFKRLKGLLDKEREPQPDSYADICHIIYNITAMNALLNPFQFEEDAQAATQEYRKIIRDTATELLYEMTAGIRTSWVKNWLFDSTDPPGTLDGVVDGIGAHCSPIETLKLLIREGAKNTGWSYAVAASIMKPAASDPIINIRIGITHAINSNRRPTTITQLKKYTEAVFRKLPITLLTPHERDVCIKVLVHAMQCNEISQVYYYCILRGFIANEFDGIGLYNNLMAHAWTTPEFQNKTVAYIFKAFLKYSTYDDYIHARFFLPKIAHILIRDGHLCQHTYIYTPRPAQRVPMDLPLSPFDIITQNYQPSIGKIAIASARMRVQKSPNVCIHNTHEYPCPNDAPFPDPPEGNTYRLYRLQEKIEIPKKK